MIVSLKQSSDQLQGTNYYPKIVLENRNNVSLEERERKSPVAQESACDIEFPLPSLKLCISSPVENSDSKDIILSPKRRTST
jgi:hypothetical protein